MKLIILIILSVFSSLGYYNSENTYQLTVQVKDLRNNKGVVQFALYNKTGTIPDEDYEKFYKILKGEIVNGSSTITFKNLPSGKYAVNILHDENKDGKIDKGFVLPTEGIGFSNFQSVGLTNRPNFEKASFEVKENKKINVKVIYM